MTTIKYTITLVNSDGTQAVASSGVLQYGQIPSDKLQSVAEFQVSTLARGTVAMMEAISKRPQAPAVPANGHRKTNGVTIGK